MPLVFASLFLLILVWISVLFRYHAYLFLPDDLSCLFQFVINILEIIPIGSSIACSWIKWVDSLETTIRNIVFNKIGVELNSLAVLSSCHPPHSAELHLVLFLFQNVFHLPSLFETELQDLKYIFNHISFDNIIYICVRPETWSVVDLKHPRLKLVVQHNIKAQQVKTKVRFFGLACSVEMR